MNESNGTPDNNTTGSTQSQPIVSPTQPQATPQPTTESTPATQPPLTSQPAPIPQPAQPEKPKKGLWKYILIALGGLAAVIAVVAIIIALFAERNVSRTVMIYMVGSDLESRNGLASDELAGIENPELVAENNINVVLIAGGSKRWKNPEISADETSIYELTSNGFEKVKTQSLRNMGDAEVFMDFLNYTTDNYHTDEYDLIFWNHGGAIQGAEYDELYDNDQLSIAEMQAALEGSKFSTGKKLETIIFSTCLNGALEIANMLQDYARYLVASEEVSMSYVGASDFTFLEEVLPSDEGYELGQKFVEKYQEKASNLKKLNAARGASSSLYSTYSVIDLAKIDKLNRTLNDFFGGIDVLGDYKKIAQVRANLYQYAQTSNDVSDYDMVDLYNLVSDLAKISTVSADKVQQAIEETVLYNYATDARSRGISIYFPYSGSKTAKAYFMDYYADIAPAKSYSKFIADFYNVQNGGVGNRMSLDDNQLKTESTGDNAMTFKLDLTDDQLANFATAKYTVVRSNPDSPGYYWPILIGGTAQLEGSTLVADVRNHQLSVKDSDGEAHTIPVAEKSISGDTIQYEFTVVLEDFREDFVIDAARIAITGNQATGEVNIENVRLLDNDDLISGLYTSLDNYETIAFASGSYNMINDDMTYNQDFESNGTFEGWEVKINDMKLQFQNEFEPGYEYYCVFIVTDVYNNTTYSKFVKLNN